MATYLIELYLPRGSTLPSQRLKTATAAAPFRHLRTIVVPVDEIGYCLVEATSAAAVAELAQAAGLEPERIVEAITEDEGDLG